jgi:hypothetical protein
MRAGASGFPPPRIKVTLIYRGHISLYHGLSRNGPVGPQPPSAQYVLGVRGGEAGGGFFVLSLPPRSRGKGDNFFFAFWDELW